MNKRMTLALTVLFMAALLCGCSFRAVADMYSIPKRSTEFQQLQLAIDEAMTGLEYCAPLSGENRQSVQLADLDGDAREEFLLFAKGGSDAPLHIHIFQEQDGKYFRTGLIRANGSAFDRVSYVDMDGNPGAELVVGTLLSDQVMRNVTVYSFSGNEPEQKLSTQYVRFLTCDLDGNSQNELMVILPGQEDTDNARAVLYGFRSGIMERSPEAELSAPADAVRRIVPNCLFGGENAVYVASSVEESGVITDIFALKEGMFTNISFSNVSGTSVSTLRNYLVYAEDMDEDGILELPALVSMKPVSGSLGPEQHLIRWFSMDITGIEVQKLHTFHNFPGGWYLAFDGDWAGRLGVSQNGGTYSFHVLDEAGKEAEMIFSLHVLTGPNREEEAVAENRFVLYRSESVVYAAKLDAASVSYGITQDSLMNSFRLIRQDWKTGET